MDKKQTFLKILTVSLGWLGVFATGLALILYGFLGTFSRFYADDFCMSGYVIRLGFWQAQWFQYTSWSNRFSGMFLLSVSDILGKSFIKYWTALAIFIWVIGLTWALLKIFGLLRIQVSIRMVLLISEWILLFSILLAPQVYQSLFWRIGLITYTIPLVLLCFLTGLLIQGYLKLKENKKAWGWILAAGFLAFFGGGLSETYLALQIALLLIALLILVITNNKEVFKTGSKPVGYALIGSLLSLVIVLIAPGNAVRQAAMPVHPGVLEFIKMVITNTFLFIYISMKTDPLQLVLAFLAPMMFVYFSGIGMTPPGKPSSFVLVVLLSPVIFCVALAAVIAPAAFAESSYPDGRVLLEAGFLFVVFMVTEGILFGTILNHLHDFAGEAVPVKLRLLTATIILIIFIYPLYDTYKSIRGIPEYQTYAAAWDARDARIKSDIIKGSNQIVETSLAAPGHLTDISTDPQNWVNNCVSYFYDLSSISAKP